jgi:hypothetical protein
MDAGLLQETLRARVILQQRARHIDTVAQVEHTVEAGTVLVGIYQDHPPATLRQGDGQIGGG